LRVVLGVHAGGDELGIVDDTVVVRINDRYSFSDVINGESDVWDRLNTLHKLLLSKLSISVLVELGESISQINNLRLWDPRSNIGEGALSKLCLGHVELHVLYH